MSHHFTYSSIRFKQIVHVIDIIRDTEFNFTSFLPKGYYLLALVAML